MFIIFVIKESIFCIMEFSIIYYMLGFCISITTHSLHICDIAGLQLFLVLQFKRKTNSRWDIFKTFSCLIFNSQTLVIINTFAAKLYIFVYPRIFQKHIVSQGWKPLKSRQKVHGTHSRSFAPRDTVAYERALQVGLIRTPRVGSS